MTYCPGKEIKTFHTGNTFLVEKEPHKGGMGIVYIARRQRDGKLYALKTFQEDKIKKEKDRKRFTEQFEWESQVWLTLGKHRNIVQAHWFDLSQDYEPFLIMEYVEGTEYGTTLGEWIENVKRKPSEEFLPAALEFTIQALTGLIYARKVVREELNNIYFIHRDIKPSNLFISQDGTLKVSDLGLVKASGSSGRGSGTPPYMPPEQWDGEEVEEKTDVYALGCVLYEMVKGESPFQLSAQEQQRVMGNASDDEGKRKAMREAIKKKHLAEQPAPLDRVPHQLNEIILKCLEKESEERLSFWELREELQSLHENLKGQRVEVKDVPELFSADDWNSRGSGFNQLGFHEKALSCYNKAISLDSKDARFYLNRGIAHFHIEQPEKAIKDYRQAVKIESDLIEAYISMGSALSKMKQYQEALECYNEAERLNPGEAMVYCGQGIVYAMRREYDEALQAFEKSLELNSDLAAAYLGLGNVYHCIGEREKAEHSYNEAKTRNPQYVDERIGTSLRTPLSGSQ